MGPAHTLSTFFQKKSHNIAISLLTLKMSSRDSQLSSDMSNHSRRHKLAAEKHRLGTAEQRRTGYNNRGRAKICLSTKKFLPSLSSPPRRTISAKKRFDMNLGRKTKTKGHFGRKGKKYNRHKKINREAVMSEIEREKSGIPALLAKPRRKNKKVKLKQDPLDTSNDPEVLAIYNKLDVLIESSLNIPEESWADANEQPMYKH